MNISKPHFQKVANRRWLKSSLLLQILRKYSVFVALVLFCTVISLMTPNFLTISNLLNVAQQISENFILALAALLVIITGGIDLSAGSVVGLAGIVTALYLLHGGNIFIAILVGIATGAVCGAVNGLLVAKTRLSPFIATLGMMGIAKGLALVITSGNSIAISNTSYQFIGSGNVLGIPTPVSIIMVLFIIVHFILKKTWMGRYLYAIGGGEETSRLSGIRVDRVQWVVYTAAGALAGLTAILLTSKLFTALPTAAEGYELNAIAAAVIGGASLMGGVGGVWGTLYGALLIGIISNGLNLMDVSSFWKQVVIGAIIIIAVLIDRFRNRAK
ncbi:ribose transport system permease protein [Paenibacillus sp. yr247]|uniref:ABC transporter permease n=1 Tax=Paenibacillus sp. yr247 TaxID=1761880 RepID=UPI00087E6546|nr:ABC transporter permease [Paenibacillus sp. yr247]SDO48320.1 ribose transport system permease protein [Paenibacillus sp. yr247]